MPKKHIYITDHDKIRLEKLIAAARKSGEENEKYLKDLENELNRGRVVKPQEIPSNVVTMNSKVRLRDLDSQEEMTYWIVFPDYANVDADKISILAPIGTALLGYKVGDIIEWKVPAGLTKLRVEEILYQPEADGKFHL